jgi:uncharacterized protein YybS (DUF2232 family)
VVAAAWRQGVPGAVTATAAGTALLAVLTGPVGAAVYASQFAAGACALGLALRARRGPLLAIGGYALLSALAFLGYATVMGAMAGRGPAGFLQDMVRQAVDQAVQFLRPASADPETTLAVQEWAAQTEQVLATIFPGLYVVLAVFTGWVNALLARRAVRDPGQETWSGWRAPEAWIWVLIVSGLVGVAAPGAARSVALNVFAVAVVVYFLQGLAVVHHLFEARRLPRIFRTVVYVLLFFQLPVMLLVAGLGAFDLWFDFRRRWAPRPPEQGLQP